MQLETSLTEGVGGVFLSLYQHLHHQQLQSFSPKLYLKEPHVRLLPAN